MAPFYFKLGDALVTFIELNTDEFGNVKALDLDDSEDESDNNNNDDEDDEAAQLKEALEASKAEQEPKPKNDEPVIEEM